MGNEKIQKRALRFAIDLTKFIFRLKGNRDLQILLNQLLRSGTSVGANLEEADSAVSKKDFIHKISIAKKEARETKYWLIILKEADLLKRQENLTNLDELLDEVNQIIKIIGAIHSKSKASLVYK
ncbi:four helix bundle protein [Candidatus Margulisiibacteriota bacterium]